MKKLLLTLSFLAFTINAQATVHYFDNGSPDNTLPCTLADPCDNFSGTTLDNAGAIAAGDSVLFKAGDEWNGLEAQLAVQSNGTANNRITFGRYGTGANPKFTGGATTTPTWTNLTGAIWYTAMSAMDSGNQPIWDVDADKGLMRTYANNNAVEAGSWCFSSSNVAGSSCANFSSGSYLFIRRWDGSDPNSHPFYIDTNVHNGGNGDRGLVRTTTNSSYGDYIDFVDLDIVAPGGIGFSTSGYNTRTSIKVRGAPRDGMLAYCASATSEAGSFWEDYYSTAEYSASFGVGYGQGLTTYCDNTTLVGTTAQYNGMAGIDYLDFGTSADVTRGLLMRVTSTNNGQNPQAADFDTDIYIDGASEVMIYGARATMAGVGASTGASNARGGGILFGSEHPTTDPAENIDLLNSYVAGIHYASMGLNNTVTNANIKNIKLRWNTFSAYNAGSFEVLTDYADLDTTADQFNQYYNVWLGDNSAVPMPLGSSIDLYDMDYNVYYRRGGSTTFFNSSSTNRTLAGWQSVSGEDANSVYSDPLFVTDSDTAPDFHLQAGSPARDLIGVPSTFSYQSWVPATVQADIGVYGVKGATLASGVYDDVSTDADAGFHYDYPSLTGDSVTPTSLTASVNTDYTVTFTLPQYVTALKYNWKIKVVFPAGTTLNSGGTTAVSNISGFNGGATASVSGQTVTITRDGDGYSTLPTTISFKLSNIGNPTAGSGGTYNIYTTDENDVQIATADSDVAANTFVSPAPTGHFDGGYFKCTWVQIT